MHMNYANLKKNCKVYTQPASLKILNLSFPVQNSKR